MGWFRNWVTCGVILTTFSVRKESPGLLWCMPNIASFNSTAQLHLETRPSATSSFTHLTKLHKPQSDILIKQHPLQLTIYEAYKLTTVKDIAIFWWKVLINWCYIIVVFHPVVSAHLIPSCWPFYTFLNQE